jgi:hypothetical protein
MTLPEGFLALAFAALVSLAGCCSAECDPERLPYRGHATTPEELAVIVQHEAHNECWSPLYDSLSKKTRDKHGRTAWRLAASSLTIPEPYDYKVVDVIEKGTFVAALPSPDNPDEALAVYDYQEPGKKQLSAHILLRREPGEELGSPKEWRIALEDQQERIERGDYRYWWFEKTVDVKPPPSKPR